MSIMRAKMEVSHVNQHTMGPENEVVQETVWFSAVVKPEYDESGADEDNTFAKFTPQATASFVILNPELLGKFTAGTKFYVDFTEA